jgi:DNA invertase Pin-like site-specific DNA recombinase
MITLSVDRTFSNPFQQDDIERLQNTIKAIIYARVSTHGQARDGYSLDSQIDMCTVMARDELQLDEDEVIAVIEAGDKGDDPNRPALNFALWLVDHGIGRKFICLHPDRFARALHLQLVVADRVWSAGYDLHFVETEEVDPNNPESMLVFNLQGAIAQYNKAKILANSRRGRRQKVKNGKIPGVRRVYGYVFDKDSDTLVENPDEKAIFLMMVDWLLNGKDGRDMTITAIARELSLLSIPAPNGDCWYQATVSRILKNPVYTGRFYYGKTEYRQRKGQTTIVKKPEGEWQMVPVPAYIDDATFEALQAKMEGLARANRGAKPHVPFLLKGMARCGRCGSAVVAGAPSRSKQTGEIMHRYYVCSGKMRKVFEVGTGREVHACHGRNWRQDVIDDYVWRYIVQVLHEPDEMFRQILERQGDPEQMRQLETRRDLMVASLSEKQEERKRWIHLNVKGRVTDEELDEALEPLEKDIKRLSTLVDAAADALNAYELNQQKVDELKTTIANFKRYLSWDISMEDKHLFAKQLVKCVVLHDDEIEIFINWDIGTPDNGPDDLDDDNKKTFV